MFQAYPTATRPAYDDAVELLSVYGETAIHEAAIRADRSRDIGNIADFCHWRQTARAIMTLNDLDGFGTLH